MQLKEKQLRKYRGKEIAFIFQDPVTSFNTLYTIGEQISETIREHLKLSKEEAYNKTLKLLEQVGVFPSKRRYFQYPYEFSGGMLQRIMIAMSIN